MKNIIYKLFFYVHIIIILLIFSCSDPWNDPGPTGEPSFTHTPESTPNPIVPRNITSVKAMNLFFNDRIRLYWEPVEHVEGYNIYRYTDRTEESLDCIFTSTGNVFDDLSALSDILYYFKVTAVAGERESDKSPVFVAGIYCSVVDFFESNEDQLTAQEIPLGYSDAVTFSFTDGETQDRDWYSFPHMNGFYRLIISFPADSPLIGLLNLKIGNNDPILLDTLIHCETVVVSEKLLFSVNFAVADPDFNGLGNYSIYCEML